MGSPVWWKISKARRRRHERLSQIDRRGPDADCPRSAATTTARRAEIRRWAWKHDLHRPASCFRQFDRQSARSGPPLESHAGEPPVWFDDRIGESRENQPLVPLPRAASDAISAGHYGDTAERKA